jgi:hypothetical protein
MQTLSCRVGDLSLYASSIQTGVYAAGEIVLDGTDFRNSAHFRFKADIFVPCGGRYVLTGHQCEAIL